MWIICKDGFEMSLIDQDDGPHAYASGSVDTKDDYLVDIGYPTQVDSLLVPYAEDKEYPTQTVYPYVPCARVQDLILKHGGPVDVKTTLGNI